MFSLEFRTTENGTLKYCLYDGQKFCVLITIRNRVCKKRSELKFKFRKCVIKFYKFNDLSVHKNEKAHCSHTRNRAFPNPLYQLRQKQFQAFLSIQHLKLFYPFKRFTPIVADTFCCFDVLLTKS